MSEPQKRVSPYRNTLMEERFNPSGFYVQNWEVATPVGVDLETIMKPEYFRQVSHRLSMYDTIKIIPDDGRFYAELLVMQASTGIGATAVLKFYHDRNPQAVEKAKVAVVQPEAQTELPSLLDNYEVKFGGHDKWRVLRKSDNAVIAKGHASREEAHAALANLVQSGGV